MGSLHLRRALAAVAIGVGLGFGTAPADEGPVIPPGQEELLLAMLGRGAGLPDGCTLADGRIEQRTVDASYTCPLGEVVVQLVHPSVAPAPAARTERFAIAIDSGSPPPSLTDALAARIRTREGEFTWLWPAEVQPEVLDDAIGERFAPDEPRW